MKPVPKDVHYQPVSSASPETKCDARRALIVGIDDYADSPLSGCVNDAERMHEVLSKHHDGSPNFDCDVQLAPKGNGHRRITRSMLRDHLEDLFEREADVALFYFSGHGMVNSIGGYLNTQGAERDGYSMAEILTFANNSKPIIKEVIIILDCCHSGAMGHEPSLNSERAILREGLSVLTSSRSTQPSMEAKGAGIFTSYVCDALEGGAADMRGNVTIADVYAYVDRALGAWNQRPLFKSHVSTLISLRQCEQVIEGSILRMITQYFEDPDAQLQLDPSFEPTAEPKNEENQKIFAHLQKMRAARMVVPEGTPHMFDAAMLRRPCRLTPLGKHYWHLAKNGLI